MQNLSLQSMRDGAVRLLFLQCLLVAIIFIIVAFAAGIPTAYSALIGGSVCVLANLFFMKYFFAFCGARAGQKIVMMMYVAEILKLLITSIFFVLAITFWHVGPLPFLLTYFVVQTSCWLSPWVFRKRTLATS